MFTLQKKKGGSWTDVLNDDGTKQYSCVQTTGGKPKRGYNGNDNNKRLRRAGRCKNNKKCTKRRDPDGNKCNKNQELICDGTCADRWKCY